MSGTDFIEFPVRRQGGVLFIACEGESEVPVRLEAVLREKCPGMEKAPFAWVEGSPRLLDPNAAKILVAMIKSASERMMQEFGVPPVLVIVDTTSKAAGYTRGGEDNDSAIAKIIERTFRAAAKACGLFILGVDHFGKDASVGTKGSSGKEDDVDVILAALGDKDITGQVSDTRLCLRKRRSGANGQELAYNMRVVDMGIDQYGSPMSTLVLDWETKPVGSDKLPRPPKDLWQKKAALRLLRKSLMAIATDQGRDFFPADDKPPVQAVDERLVRQEFYTRFLAEGTPEQKADTRRKAFKRAVDEAQRDELVGVREDEDGVTWIWMTSPSA
jgi:AAA domain